MTRSGLLAAVCGYSTFSNPGSSIITPKPVGNQFKDRTPQNADGFLHRVLSTEHARWRPSWRDVRTTCLGYPEHEDTICIFIKEPTEQEQVGPRYGTSTGQLGGRERRDNKSGGHDQDGRSQIKQEVPAEEKNLGNPRKDQSQRFKEIFGRWTLLHGFTTGLSYRRCGSE